MMYPLIQMECVCVLGHSEVSVARIKRVNFRENIWAFMSFSTAVSQNSAKLGNYKIPVKLRET